MKPSRRILTAFLAISLTTPALCADNTLRGRKLRAGSRAMRSGLTVTPPDTVRAPSRDSIQASGYDKPLRTNRETLLITNAGTTPLEGLSLTISYFDMQGRQLHERTDTLKTRVPPGSTRMIHLSTWDRQHSYYYHRGQKPRTANVTPYDIRCRINFILTRNEND